MSTSQTRDSATAGSAPPATADPQAVASADRMAHAAVLVSGLRCIMMYVLLPAAGPVVSQFNGVILPINLLMHVVTLVTTTLAMRRARRSNHPLRRLYMMLGAFFFLFSLVTMAFELLLVFGRPA